MAWWSELRKYLKDTLGKLWGKEVVRQWLLAAIVYLTLVGILLANLLPDRAELRVGQVAKQDIAAPKTIVNRYRTEQLRQQMGEKAVEKALKDPENYMIDEKAVTAAREKLGLVFDRAREERSSLSPVDPSNEASAPLARRLAPAAQQVEDFQDAIESETGITLDKQTVRTLLSLGPQQFDGLEQAALTLAGDLLGTVKIRPEDLPQVAQRVPEQAEDYLSNANVLPADPNSADALIRALTQLVEAVVRPNLIPDEEKLQAIRSQAAAQVEPIVVLQGEIVVRRGDVITREKAQILKDLGLQRRRTDYWAMIGIAGVVLLELVFVGVYIWQHQRGLFENENLMALLGLLLIISVFLVKILSLIAWEGVGYLVPTSFAAMLITLLLDSRLAIVVVVMLGFTVGLVTSFQLPTVATAVAGGFAGVFSLGRVTQRSDVTRAGFVAGVVNFFTIVFMALATNNIFILKHSYLGIINGIISAVLTIGFLPYLESLFGITSSIKLLELSNPNQPLLRRLLMEAPGTYHHSVIVGNLAETAAEAVGGDGLLARVGANYHDIGKLKRPYFFIENQISAENPHDKLSPSLSTLIITSHVKDGLELAKQYKLPPALSDFIAQHHGEDLVKFFYHKAVEAGQEVDEEDFRYPGPKPQTKETAIVMLADSVEAAVRSLSKPTPGRIEGLVRKIIKTRLTDGQLDESNLTLKDLDKIAQAFVQVLGGIFHTRVEYPESALREELSEVNKRQYQ